MSIRFQKGIDEQWLHMLDFLGDGMFFHGESVCLQVDQDVTAQCSARVVPITMALFLKYSHGESTCRHIIRLIAVFQVWMHTHT